MISSARLGDQHACPLPGHGITPIATASGDVLINALCAARVGDICACGAVIVAGFPSIMVNGRPMAHLGSPTSHGGMLVTGSQDVGGGFTFGGAAASRVIDFSHLGILQPDGTLDEQRLESLLADPQLAEKAEAAGAVVDPLASSNALIKADQLCEHPDEIRCLAGYITGEMNRNIHHPVVIKMKKLLSYDVAEETRKWMALPWYAKVGVANSPQVIGSANATAALALWAERVGQDRPWDHKPSIRAMFRGRTWNKQGVYMYYYDIWSNIHYGYVGMSAGLSAEVLLDGAGLEQIASDTLRKIWDWEMPGPRPTDGVEGLRAWDDAPDRISIGLGIELYGLFPDGEVSKDVVIKLVLAVDKREWHKGIALHDCNNLKHTR
jgi:uncharacterized Zn-binding protein involved in type VI secretion